MADLKRGTRTFSLTGTFKKTNNSFVLNKSKEGSDYVYSCANLMFEADSGNVFVNLLGGHFENNKENYIYALGLIDEGGKTKIDYTHQIKVPYDKRTDERILAGLSTSSMIVCKVEQDADGELIEKHFLAKEDAIDYLNQVLVEDKVYNVSGDISFRPDANDNILTTFNLKRIYLNTYANPKVHATYTLTVLVDKDALDMAKPDNNGYVQLNCYVPEYVRAWHNIQKAIVPLPVKLFIDTTKNEQWKDGIHTFFIPRSNNVTEITVDGHIASIGNVQTVSLDDVSDDIKALIKLNIMTMDEISKVGTNNNSLTSHLVISNPHIEIKDGKMLIQYNKEKYVLDDLNLDMIAKNHTLDTKVDKTDDVKKSAPKTVEPIGLESRAEDDDADTDALMKQLFGNK